MPSAVAQPVWFISRTAEPLQLAMASVARRYAILGGIAGTATLLAMIAAALLFSQTRPTIARIDDDLQDLLVGGGASEGYRVFGRSGRAAMGGGTRRGLCGSPPNPRPHCPTASAGVLLMYKRLSDPMVQGLALAAFVLLLALGAVSWLTMISGNRVLFPELARTALAEAVQAQRKIDAAVALGIPVDRLVGVEKLYEAMKASDSNIAFLAVTAGQRTLFLQGARPGVIERLLQAPTESSADGLAPQQSMREGFLLTSLPLRAGVFYLGHDSRSLTKPLFDNLIDVGVIALVSGMLAFEVMLLVVVFNVVQPAQTVAAALRGVAGERAGRRQCHRGWRGDRRATGAYRLSSWSCPAN